MRCGWNIDERSFKEITVYSIELTTACYGEHMQILERRLFCCAHFLSSKGIPSTFSKDSSGNPCVVCFDIDSCFLNEYVLPQFSITSFQWSMDGSFPNNIMEQFQRALTTLSFYQFPECQCHYFTTYILIEGLTLDVLFYKQYPVLKGDLLCIRTITYQCPFLAHATPSIVNVDTFILIPPYEHPFWKSKDNEKGSAFYYADGDPYFIDLDDHEFFVIFNPPPALCIYYQRPNTSRPPKPTHVVALTQEEICSFLDSREDNPDIESEYTPSTVWNAIFEELAIPSDIGEQMQSVYPRIHNCPLFAPKVTLSRTHMHSFCWVDFGMNTSTLNELWADKSPEVCGSSLAIPSVKVNKEGLLEPVSADRVIGEWKKSLCIPLYGPKTITYLCLAEEPLSTEEVSCFIRGLVHEYTSYNFGSLEPEHSVRTINIVSRRDIQPSLTQFYSSHPLAELRSVPCIVLFISSQELPSDFKHPESLFRICPALIKQHTSTDLEQTAFELYSSVKCYIPNIKGESRDPSLAYGYRIQPPFLLVPSQASKQLFFAWDISSHFGVWTDEIGSFFQPSEFVTPRDILGLVDRFEKDMEVRNVELFISFVRTPPTSEFLDEIEGALRIRSKEASITTIDPAPHIQATKREDPEDIFVLDERERTDGTGETRDICSGFVIPNGLPGYQITLSQKINLLYFRYKTKRYRLLKLPNFCSKSSKIDCLPQTILFLTLFL